MYKHILLATDLGTTSDRLNTISRSMAMQCHAKLSLVHTIEAIPAYGYPGVIDLQDAMMNAARKCLDELAQTLNVPIESQHVEFGSVKTQVLRVAEELGVDLILIGSHGRHGLSRLLGSSASGIIHGAHCDVLTVRCV